MNPRDFFRFGLAAVLYLGLFLLACDLLAP